MYEPIRESVSQWSGARPGISWKANRDDIGIQPWRDIDDAFLHLISAYEALEKIEASSDFEVFSMSLELAAGSVCTALVALDDYRDATCATFSGLGHADNLIESPY